MIEIQQVSMENYLDAEELTLGQNEYLNGHVYPISSPHERHNLIVGNLYYHLRTATRGSRCRVFMSTMKLRINERSTFYYPDLMVCCDSEDNHNLYKSRPFLIAEVLSTTTEVIDRREKLIAYQDIPSLQYYFLIASHQMQADYYQRTGDGSWSGTRLEHDNIVEIDCPGAKTIFLCLNDFYQEVPMP